MTAFQFGRPRYFRPICVLQRFGFIGGPAGYVEVPAGERDVGPLIIRAIETGDPPLWRVEEELDRREREGKP